MWERWWQSVMVYYEDFFWVKTYEQNGSPIFLLILLACTTISTGYENRTKPPARNPRHPRKVPRERTHAPCCRWPPRRRHLRAAAGTARTPPPPPAQTTSQSHSHLRLRLRRRHHLRSAAPALRQPLHWIRSSRSGRRRRRSGAPRRSGR